MAVLEDKSAVEGFWLLETALACRFFLPDPFLEVADASLVREPHSDPGLADLRFLQLVLQNGDDAQLELIDRALAREVDAVVAVVVRPSLAVERLWALNCPAAVLAEAEHLRVCAYEEYRKLYKDHSHT